MQIRPITRDELDLFATFSPDPEANQELHDYILRQWDSGFSRPEWCFMQSDSAILAMRAVYWSLPNAAFPGAIARLELPWHTDYFGLGTRFVRATLDRARDLGSTSLTCLIETPPSTYPERRAEVLEALGFRLMRDGLRWEWLPTSTPVHVPDRLTYRTLDDVGEPAFIDAIRCVSTGTRDSWIRSMIAESGPEAAAKQMYDDASTLPHEPHWWLLAYTSTGDLVGLVMMCRNNFCPIVDYVGVVPEQRGRGYANDLLAMGTSIMQAEGAERIRGDTDRENHAMSKAFARLGYNQFRTARNYAIKL